MSWISLECSVSISDLTCPKLSLDSRPSHPNLSLHVLHDSHFPTPTAAS